MIVAAFQLRLGAIATSEDVPVPGGTAAFAASLSIDPVPDRGRFMFELTRLVHETIEPRNAAIAEFLLRARQAQRGQRPAMPEATARASDLVPVPLTADVWGDAIFHRRLRPGELVTAILSDRAASLLCHGLLQLDDETLEYLAGHQSILSRLYERSAPIFAGFGSAIRIHQNRIVPPGDEAAAALWEVALNEKTTRVDKFLQLLFESNDGRIAYLYDAIGRLDAPHRAFALGTWIANDAKRQDRFKALTTAGVGSIRDLHVRTAPFNRPSYDFGMALSRLRVDEHGAPSAPSAQSLWARVVGVSETVEDAPIDAAWIAENLVGTDVRQRGERLDQLAFAQRLFGSFDGDRAELVFVLRSMSRYRAMMLTFDRAGIKSIETYAGAIRHAARMAKLDGRSGYVAQALYQGALVLVTRMTTTGTIDAATAERLINQLASAQAIDGTLTGGGVARWMRESLAPVLPAARDFEGALIAGLGGHDPTVNAPRVVWEGQQYRLNLAASERNRLRRVREKQGGAPVIDLPMQLADAARTLVTGQPTADDLQDIAGQFTALSTDIPQLSREEEADNLPFGVAPPPAHSELLRKAADDLKATRSKDVKRAARIAEPIVEVADDLLARSLLSFAYAISLGDPDGTVLLADDVSQRHDFGFGLKDSEMRARLVWAMPRQDVAPGVPWHVSGSLLSLDTALSALALRRVSSDHVLEAPKLTSNMREAFAISVSLMDPLALRDADRDAIAAALDRGRRRVLEASSPALLDAIIAELFVDGARRRTLRWTLAHEPERLVSMFSLTELMTLGGASLSEFQAWGMAVLPNTGCLCSRVMAPGSWPSLAGRPQLGLTAAIVPDVNFRVAVMLKELGLPAPLAKVVLSAAVQDFIDEVRPTDDADWLTLSRAARVIGRERIEDYVAAATATGPLMPVEVRSPGNQR
ncbi:MAG TPA: hypothetical protein VH583_06260 [Vicinamibacterales bacterium]|jgi:hypothetical protein